jgi:hypothetical protein
MVAEMQSMAEKIRRVSEMRWTKHEIWSTEE